MRYRFTAVSRIRGVALPSGTNAYEVVASQAKQVRAMLVSDPSIQCVDLDRDRAIANMMLNGLFRSADPSFTVNRLANAMSELRESRTKQYGTGPYLVVHVEGESGAFAATEHVRELDEFVVYVDGINKKPLRDESRPKVAAVVAALSLGLGTVSGLDAVTDGLVFFRDDGKPVHSFSVELSAELTVGQSATDETLRTISQWYEEVEDASSLQRVARLLVASLDASADKLRSFITAWAALEIFTNKVFASYEQSFLGALAQHHHPRVQSDFVDRIRTVMKGKYNIADRFSLLLSQLCPDSADADFERFRLAKEKRDGLAHGQDVDERTLPTSAVRDLTLKYLRLHLERS